MLLCKPRMLMLTSAFVLLFQGGKMNGNLLANLYNLVGHVIHPHRDQKIHYKQGWAHLQIVMIPLCQIASTGNWRVRKRSKVVLSMEFILVRKKPGNGQASG